MSTVQDLLTRQQLFVMIKSNLLQSLQLHYLPLQSQNWNTQLPTVRIQQLLPQCNRLQRNCSQLL